MGNRSPVYRTIQNCSMYFQGVGANAGQCDAIAHPWRAGDSGHAGASPCWQEASEGGAWQRRL